MDQLSPPWFALRRPDNSVTFTASNIAALIGFSNYATAVSAYHQILKAAFDEDEQDTSSTKYTRAGQKMEQPVCDALLRYLRPQFPEFDDKITLRKVGIFASIGTPWILASPDRILHCDAPGFAYDGWLVEIKFHCFRMPEQPYPSHLIQCMAQMAVTKSSNMFLVYCFGSQMQVYTVWFRAQLWSWIYSKLEMLRRDLVAKKEWNNQISSHYHALDSYWKSGKLTSKWKNSCDCEIHRKWRTTNSRSAPKRGKSVQFGPDRCENLPPAPRISILVSTTDDVLGENAADVLFSEGFVPNSKSKSSSSSSFYTSSSSTLSALAEPFIFS